MSLWKTKSAIISWDGSNCEFCGFEMWIYPSDRLPMLLWNNQMDVTRCQIFKSPLLMSDLQRWGRGGGSNQRPLACSANALSHRDKLPYCEFLHKELNLKDSVSFCIFPEISWTCEVFSPGRKSQPDDKVRNWPGHQIISQQDQKGPLLPPW